MSGPQTGPQGEPKKGGPPPWINPQLQQEDGMTDEIAAELRGFGSKIVTDPVAFGWLYEGGALPAA